MRKLLFLCAALLSSATLLFADDINYLTFTAEEAGSTVKFIKTNGSDQTINLEYNLNNGGWNTYTLGKVITLTNEDDAVMFRGKNKQFAAMSGSSWTYVHSFRFSGKIAASGNIMSIILNNDGSLRTEVPAYAFAQLFKGSSDADKYCLTSAPELPATQVSARSYASMFASCKALTKAPELPATTLGDYCYQSMFEYCSALVEGPSILPATSWGNTGNEHPGCYSSMFSSCTSLVRAPKLPATKLITTTNRNSVYSSMFSGCSSLNYIDMDAPGSLSATYTSMNWVKGVSSTGTFVCPKPVTYFSPSESTYPSGWTLVYKYSIADGTAFSTDITKDKTYHITVTGREISADYYNTICLPFAVPSFEGTPFEGGKVVAFESAEMVGDELVLQFHYVDAIEAGVPYLFKPAQTLTSPIEFGVVTMGSSLDPQTSTSEHVDFVGITKAKSVTANDNILVLSTDNNLYKLDKTRTMPNFRGYFVLKTPIAKAARMSSIQINPAPTGIKNVKANGPAKKVMENGHFVIVRNGEKYNAMGQLEK